jgi:hypothetical protein
VAADRRVEPADPELEGSKRSLRIKLPPRKVQRRFFATVHPEGIRNSSMPASVDDHVEDVPSGAECNDVAKPIPSKRNARCLRRPFWPGRRVQDERAATPIDFPWSMGKDRLTESCRRPWVDHDIAKLQGAEVQPRQDARLIEPPRGRTALSDLAKHGLGQRHVL